MKSKKENTPDEFQRMEQYLECQIARKEVIGLLDGYSCCFADWSITISEAIHETMAKRQQLNVDCEKERTMLEHLSYLFTKLSYFNGMLSDWHKEMTITVENTQKMLK